MPIHDGGKWCDEHRRTDCNHGYAQPVPVPAAEPAAEEKLPVRYYRDGGLVCAVYGSSSIHYVDDLRVRNETLSADLKSARTEIEQLREIADGMAEKWYDRCEVGSTTCRWCGRYCLDAQPWPGHADDCYATRLAALQKEKKDASIR